MTAATAWTAVCAGAVAVLLAAERSRSRLGGGANEGSIGKIPGHRFAALGPSGRAARATASTPRLAWARQGGLRVPAKLIASTAFLAVVVSVGGLGTTYGRWIAAGLLASWIGDAALLSDAAAGFLLGLVAFGVAHVLYGAGFLTGGGSWLPVALSVPVLGVVALVVWRWMRPHLAAGLVGPVAGYVLVISLMLAFAARAAQGRTDWRIVAGAFAFYLSDLAVARDRFVAPGFVNRLWGLPLYYGGQVLLAFSTG